jgi:hypothetical protein
MLKETDTTPVLIEAGEYFALSASVLGSILFGVIMFIH